MAFPAVIEPGSGSSGTGVTILAHVDAMGHVWHVGSPETGALISAMEVKFPVAKFVRAFSSSDCSGSYYLKSPNGSFPMPRITMRIDDDTYVVRNDAAFMITSPALFSIRDQPDGSCRTASISAGNALRQVDLTVAAPPVGAITPPLHPVAL